MVVAAPALLMVGVTIAPSNVSLMESDLTRAVPSVRSTLSPKGELVEAVTTGGRAFVAMAGGGAPENGGATLTPESSQGARPLSNTKAIPQTALPSRPTRPA